MAVDNHPLKSRQLESINGPLSTVIYIYIYVYIYIHICIYVCVYVPTTPGIKMKHDTFLPAVSASAQRLMGDPSLRCLTCGGKFGAPVSDLRCELCSLVFRFQDVVSSDRFPATGGQFVVPDLRSLYLKSLEVCDSYLRFQQGDKESPRTQEGEAKKEEPDKQLLTTPKVKPPVKKELADEKEEKKVFKEEDVKRAKSPEQRIEAEVRKENKERKTTSRDREGDVRARSSGIHRRRERTRSASRRPRGDKERKPRRGDSQDRRSPLVRDRRGRSGERRRGGEADGGRRRSSPLRPRSPSGPPPPRTEERRWSGPIPAYYSRGQEEYRDERRQPQNKGAKKRRQQALFSEFKAWRKRYKCQEGR